MLFQKILFSLLMVVYSSVDIVTSTCDDLQAIVTQQAHNEGFHRTIQYVVNLYGHGDQELWARGFCMLSLRQVLPSGACVNADELNDMRRFNKVHACPVGHVDIEKPKHMSRPVTVHLYAPINSSKVTVNLPIHLRYHRARENGGFDLVKIPYPWVLLRCPNNVFKMCSPSDAMVIPCGPCSSQKCSWHNISTVPLTSMVELSVPVGNVNDYNFVLVTSYILSFGGCLYILLTTLRVDMAAAMSSKDEKKIRKKNS